MKTNNVDATSLTIAILSKEIIRLKALCLKAAEHIVVEDDESLNLKNALVSKKSPSDTVDYEKLQKESSLATIPQNMKDGE